LNFYSKLNKETYLHIQHLTKILDEEGRTNMIFDATVIANALSKDGGRSGIFFVAYNLLTEMLKREDLNIILYCESSRKVDLKKVLNNDFYQYSDIQIIDSIKLNDFNDKKIETILQNTNSYFSPLFKIPVRIKENGKILKFTVIYDTILLIHPEFFPVKQDWLLEMIDEINVNDFYFAISENTKKDFIKHVPTIDPDKIKVTYLAADKRFHPANNITAYNYRILRKYNLPLNKQYIFSLCTLEPRKNLILTVKSFIAFIKKNKINNLYFFLGGSQWDKFIVELEREIGNLNKYKNRIIRVGYIDDEDLPYFYNGSRFFVYPSLYEGFGLPVLEAMQCGTPVITSNTSSLPEVIGDSGIMINPKSEIELIEAMEELYFNNQLSVELSIKGIERAKQFSWGKTADIMASVINGLVINNQSNKINTELIQDNISDNNFNQTKDNNFISVRQIIQSPCKYFFKFISNIFLFRKY